MAEALVTQVQQPGTDSAGGIASLATQVQQDSKASKAPAKKAPSKKGIFCCICSTDAVDAPRPAEAPKPVAASAPAASAGGDSGAAASEEADPQWLLKPLLPTEPKKCLVLDLDETLVHSSFKPISDADFTIDIELEGMVHRVYVRKRPGVDEFLLDVGKKWEVVIFTASLAKYADPLLDILDIHKVVKYRLFREACVQHYGNYVKDLSLLGRRLEDTVIVDNSPFSYMFQPDNAIPIISWFNDRQDTQLFELMPFLDSLLHVDDVTTILQKQPIGE